MRARCAARDVGVHVKLDTGMGRLGTRDPDEATRVAEAVAAAPGPAARGRDDPLRDLRRRPRVHGRAARALPPVGGPVRRRCATPPTPPATLGEPAARLDMVRCGIAIYGMDPFHRDPAEHGLEPALELVSYVAEVKRARAGESAGYGRRFIAERDTWIGDDPDRLRRRRPPRADRNRVEVLVGGRRVPVVGTVSMDNITVDLGDAAGRARHRGGADRRARRRAHPRRGLGARARHDQLRDHVRDHAARAAALHVSEALEVARGGARRRGRRGSSAARCATGCSAARPTTSTSRSRATRSRYARKLARATRGDGVRAQRRVRRLAGGRARATRGTSTS